MNLTFNQKVAFAVAALSFLAAGGSATDLIVIFGSNIAKVIAAASSIGAGLGGIFLALVTGQANLVKDVNNMTGVDRIIVNSRANQTLAAIAVDPNSKVEASPEAAAAVAQTAKG